MKNAQELRMMLKESYELSKNGRLDAQKHRRYFDGDQLSGEVLEVLNSRGQPVKWENLYQKIGNKILGYKMTAKQMVKVGGRQRNDMGVAQLLTDICASIPDSTDYNAHKERADEDLMITGQSVMECSIHTLPMRDIEGKNEKEIRGYHVPFDEAFTDPYSKAPDYSDARYIHRVRWIDRDALYQYFDADKVDALLNQHNYTNDWNLYEHRQKSGMRDPSRDRIMVTYTWCREYDKVAQRSKICWYVWSNNVILSSGDNPYRFDRFPFVVRKLYHNNGVMRGIFHDIMPIQDSINFMHLRIANMLGSVKLLFEAGAVDDAQLFAEEYSKDDAVVMLRDGALSENKIKEIKHSAEIQHLMQLIIDARRQAEQIVGLNDEALGAAVNRMSGYAIEQRQNAGMVGLQRFLNTSSKVDEDFYKTAIEFVQQFYDAEQIIRIVEPNQAEQYLTINEIERDGYGAAVREKDGAMKRKNKITVGRYDITVSMAPANRGAIGERYKNGVELMKMIAQINPKLAEAFLPELMDDVESPSAAKIRTMIEEMAKAPKDDQAAQMQQQSVQLQMQQMQSKIKELESKAMLNASKAQKNMAESGGMYESGGEETMGQPVEEAS